MTYFRNKIKFHDVFSKKNQISRRIFKKIKFVDVFKKKIKFHDVFSKKINQIS
jgi:hypothetical protein